MRDASVHPRRSARAMERRRLRAAVLLERGESLSSIARQLRVSRQAVFVWAEQWRRRGEAGLLRRLRPGRPSVLTRRQWAQLQRLLARGAEAHGYPSPIWTWDRVIELIENRFGVTYGDAHVVRILHRLGWRWQKRTRKDRARGGAGIQYCWVRHTGAHLKEKRAV